MSAIPCYRENLAELLLSNKHHESADTLYLYKEDQIRRQHFSVSVRALASELQRAINPGDHILIMLNDSPSLAQMFLAVIAVGGVPAIINPKIRNETVEEMIRQKIPAFIVTSFEKAHTLPHWSDIEIIIFEEAAPGGTQLSPEQFGFACGNPEWNDFHRVPNNEVCYLQYTSGSTGTPKGVMHSTSGTMAFCKAVADNLLALNAGDICYSAPKMFFGYGMGNSLFFPIYAGCTAILDDAWPTPKGIIANIAQYKPSVLFAVPAIYSALESQAGLIAKSVSKAVSAGAPLPEAEYRYWISQGIEICDGIGATEVGHIFLANRLGRSRPGATGQVLPGYQCMLVDESGDEIVNTGTQGVLLVKGGSVSSGYFGQPEKTSEKFDQGWYRTGDNFVMDADGYYYYRGREDDMFKVNGRWVTPALIEHSLLEEFPSILECAVVPTAHGAAPVQPVLFLVTDQQSVTTEAVLAFIRHRFDSYMHPARVLYLESLPRNDNGKVVRKEMTRMATQQNDPVEAPICA
ncbi:AMP-binding protein [Microbulbifer elongatus]|uniref:AMP-binding protein n=1 Tax=Microbulbifer elongatus TaxID=86173 RepID=A0ABT1P3M6_9GAMM|nr:AMP-binding protein [Microbulbifer elongatus]MCQ3830722.1 AMP-binding protein [Microbulbifer elongatus]